MTSHMYRFAYITLFIFLIISVKTSAQSSLTWDELGRISFTTAKNETSGYSYMKPIFSDKVEDLDGKTIRITGYMIPLDTDGFEYVISAYPNSACFSCGGAGKESVVELELQSYERRYEVDEIVTFEGTYELNLDEFGLCYRLLEDKPLQ